MSNSSFATPAGAAGQAIAFLQQRFGERVNTSLAVREQHARGEGIAARQAPDAVVWPLDKQEVSDLCLIHLTHH